MITTAASIILDPEGQKIAKHSLSHKEKKYY